MVRFQDGTSPLSFGPAGRCKAGVDQKKPMLSSSSAKTSLAPLGDASKEQSPGQCLGDYKFVDLAVSCHGRLSLTQSRRNPAPLPRSESLRTRRPHVTELSGST